MALPVLLTASRRQIPITVKTHGVLLDENLAHVIYAHLRTALGRFGKRVRSVLVRVEDTNGPREGSGIRCRIVVVLKPGGRLSASAEAANEYAAVAECASRARTLLDRLVKRRRRTRRPPRAHGRQHFN
jgi:putative sigma-54 modulation protein